MSQGLKEVTDHNGAIKDKTKIPKLIQLIRSEKEMRGRLLLSAAIKASSTPLLRELINQGVIPLLEEWLVDVVRNKKFDFAKVVVGILNQMPVSLEDLRKSEIAKTLMKLRKCENEGLALESRKLVDKWKLFVKPAPNGTLPPSTPKLSPADTLVGQKHPRDVEGKSEEENVPNKRVKLPAQNQGEDNKSQLVQSGVAAFPLDSLLPSASTLSTSPQTNTSNKPTNVSRTAVTSTINSSIQPSNKQMPTMSSGSPSVISAVASLTKQDGSQLPTDSKQPISTFTSSVLPVGFDITKTLISQVIQEENSMTTSVWRPTSTTLTPSKPKLYEFASSSENTPKSVLMNAADVDSSYPSSVVMYSRSRCLQRSEHNKNNNQHPQVPVNKHVQPSPGKGNFGNQFNCEPESVFSKAPDQPTENQSTSQMQTQQGKPLQDGASNMNSNVTSSINPTGSVSDPEKWKIKQDLGTRVLPKEFDLPPSMLAAGSTWTSGYAMESKQPQRNCVQMVPVGKGSQNTDQEQTQQQIKEDIVDESKIGGPTTNQQLLKASLKVSEEGRKDQSVGSGSSKLKIDRKSVRWFEESLEAVRYFRPMDPATAVRNDPDPDDIVELTHDAKFTTIARQEHANEMQAQRQSQQLISSLQHMTTQTVFSTPPLMEYPDQANWGIGRGKESFEVHIQTKVRTKVVSYQTLRDIPDTPQSPPTRSEPTLTQEPQLIPWNDAQQQADLDYQQQQQQQQQASDSPAQQPLDLPPNIKPVLIIREEGEQYQLTGANIDLNYLVGKEIGYVEQGEDKINIFVKNAPAMVKLATNVDLDRSGENHREHLNGETHDYDPLDPHQYYHHHYQDYRDYRDYREREEYWRDDYDHRGYHEYDDYDRFDEYFTDRMYRYPRGGGGRERRVCRYYNSSVGCRNGDKCPFLHVRD